MNIVFVGLSGALKQTRACDLRLAMFANVMVEDNRVQVLNRYSSLHTLNSTNVKVDDRVEQYEIIKSRDTGRLLSLFLFFLSVFAEPFVLIWRSRKEHIDILHVYSGHFFDFLNYYFVSRIIGAKVLYQYVEYKSVFQSSTIYHRINNYLCDHIGPYFWDGVIAISAYLEKAALAINGKLISIKIPPICDFSLYERIQGKVDIKEPYLLFCGSVGYMEVIDFIIESYRKSYISLEHKLVFVLSGNKKTINAFAETNKDVVVKHDLSYHDLICHYKNARALLIPLRDNIRDTARFPNKICEYLAANGVIVTTNVGEIKEFFIDGKNAIVSSNYSVASYSNVLDNIVDGKYDLPSLSTNAYQIGLKYFDIAIIRDRFLPFIRLFTPKLNSNK